jgi:hypothetical protein
MKIRSGWEVVEGTLGAWKVFPDGTKEEIFLKKNLIIRLAKLHLLSALYNPSFVQDRITTFKLGTGGAIDPEGLFPKPENAEQTDLITPQISVQTSYVEYPLDVKVTYLADLDQSEGNGLKITEAGLFKASGAIFNVKNFPAVPKTSEFGLHFEWSIKAV